MCANCAHRLTTKKENRKVRTLKQVEQSIVNGHKSFVQLGEDYKAIRDGDFAEAAKAMGSNRNKNYGAVMQAVLGQPTLKAYWNVRWGLTIQRVNQIIEAAGFYADLKSAGVPEAELPKNAATARKGAGAAKKAAKKAGRSKPTAADKIEGNKASKKRGARKGVTNDNIVAGPYTLKSLHLDLLGVVARAKESGLSLVVILDEIHELHKTLLAEYNKREQARARK